MAGPEDRHCEGCDQHDDCRERFAALTPYLQHRPNCPEIRARTGLVCQCGLTGVATTLANRLPRPHIADQPEHRPELFLTMCRGCGGRNVYFARRPGRRYLRAVCATCNEWEYIE